MQYEVSNAVGKAERRGGARKNKFKGQTAFPPFHPISIVIPPPPRNEMPAHL